VALRSCRLVCRCLRSGRLSARILRGPQPYRGRRAAFGFAVAVALAVAVAVALAVALALAVAVAVAAESAPAFEFAVASVAATVASAVRERISVGAFEFAVAYVAATFQRDFCASLGWAPLNFPLRGSATILPAHLPPNLLLPLNLQLPM
jgi:hypothetical protein